MIGVQSEEFVKCRPHAFALQRKNHEASRPITGPRGVCTQSHGSSCQLATVVDRVIAGPRYTETEYV
jgi:hypothetical protein